MQPWSAPRKIAFRFFFVLFVLVASPWEWFYAVPGLNYLIDLITSAPTIFVVNFFNAHFLHVKETLNLNGGGSGDTSFAWAQIYTFIILSVIGSLVWSLLDRKKLSYTKLDFWLKNIVRYFVCMQAFRYGIIKVFTVQMLFPNLSQLATPLGDFLPMRLSWMFVGYSERYQIFSGIMELMVGILLLNRKTVTVGILMGVGVFANVVALNISYDIPVKLFSITILCCCLFLAANQLSRIVSFLFNKPVEPDNSYEIKLTAKWQIAGRWLWKVAFIILFIGFPINNAMSWLSAELNKKELKPIKAGVYEVKYFVRNNDTIPQLSTDTITWKDVIFDKGGLGSVNSRDTLFRQRYRRGYFTYRPDSLNRTISVRKNAADTSSLFLMKFKQPDENTLVLRTKLRGDSVYIKLLRSKRHFQLAERQFHWISESNR